MGVAVRDRVGWGGRFRMMRPHACACAAPDRGCAEAPVQVYIYYPLSGCVVFGVHCGWWFGVFCHCEWWVFMQSSVYLCVKGYSPHYLKRMCVLVSGSRSIFWVDNLLPCTLVR